MKIDSIVDKCIKENGDTLNFYNCMYNIIFKYKKLVSMKDEDIKYLYSRLHTMIKVTCIEIHSIII